MDIKKLRMAVDISMVILLPVLIGYSLVGETAHEIIGVVMGVLFAVHITLNRKWFAALFRGRYGLRRSITTILNIMLILLLEAGGCFMGILTIKNPGFVRWKRRYVMSVEIKSLLENTDKSKLSR